jgi:hypothetical protein
MPSLGILVLTEFTRGLIHAAALVPWLSRMSGRRAQSAVLAGLALAILGGVAALLLPVDDILPPEVRRVHMVEILGCNFLFGVIASQLLLPRAPATVRVGVGPILMTADGDLPKHQHGEHRRPKKLSRKCHGISGGSVAVALCSCL